MKTTKLAVVLATTSALCAATASGQTGTTLRVSQPRGLTHAAFEYEHYHRQPREELAPAIPPAEAYYRQPPPVQPRQPGNGHAPACAAPAAHEPGCAAPHEPGCGQPACEEPACGEPACGEPACGEPGCGANNGCACPHCGCHHECCLGEPWVLFDDCCLKQHNLTIAGWIDQGYTWNPDDPFDNFNGPLTFNDRANEYQMNQLYLYLERETDTENYPLDVGGRVDLLYGTDWRFTPALGLELHRDGSRRWNQEHRFYGLAMPQLYGQVALNDLDVKLGRWYTTAGYEVVQATGNFFYSHLFTHQYGEPFTHTGALATFKYSDNWTVHGGVHRGWDQWEDLNDDLAMIAGATWTSCDENTSLAFVMTYGDEAPRIFGATNNQDRYYQSIVLTRKFNDRWTYVAHSDFGHQANVNGDQDAEWYSISQYLLYKVNDCLSYGVRYEWFRDDDGFRVFGVGAGAAPDLGFVGGNYVGTFQDITIGLNYRPNANVLIRPELRWDWYDGLPSGINNRPLPFDGGTDSSQFTAAADMIITF